MSKRPKRLTISQVKKNVASLLSCKHISDVEALLGLSRLTLTKHALHPEYYKFKVPKKNGEMRSIEAPSHNLKRVQRRINNILQSFYYLIQPEASHGFIIKVRGKPGKNILSNARAHLNCKYMLNADFDDFFHQITQEDIFTILMKYPLHLTKETAHILSKVCTHEGRLPMGAPTSPVLSNMYCVELDKSMSDWAISRGYIYTRFVDDLSVSSQGEQLDDSTFMKMMKVASEFDLYFDHAKTKVYGRSEQKKVTGLIVGDVIQVPSSYCKMLEEDIERLRRVMEAHVITGRIYPTPVIRLLQQETQGKLNFVHQILGDSSSTYMRLYERYDRALHPDESLLSVRWLQFANYSRY